ncbi:MAG TPA: hypothetical protein VFV12_00460, partial [Xanthobacteraceae bacterium]|nr:hypothetical protein [Xanthobacteraceae bacterium]
PSFGSAETPITPSDSKVDRVGSAGLFAARYVANLADIPDIGRDRLRIDKNPSPILSRRLSGQMG